MPSEDTLSLLFVAFLFLIIFVGAFMVVKKRWINKKPNIYSAQFTGQNVYMRYQNLQKKKALEHVIYQKEEKNRMMKAMI